MRNYSIIALLIVSLLGNFILFYLWQSSSGLDHNLQSTYPFLSRRAVDPNYPNDLTVSFLPLRRQIHKEVDPYAQTFAVYFEYLPTGTTIGINEDRKFTAESFLKVPVVMAYFHKKERLGLQADPDVQIKASELNDKFGGLYKKKALFKKPNHSSILNPKS